MGWEGGKAFFLYRLPSILEKEMATHCSILAWKIPRMEEPGRQQSMGLQSDMTEQLHSLTHHQYMAIHGANLNDILFQLTYQNFFK